jgi:hypothetical protein
MNGNDLHLCHTSSVALARRSPPQAFLTFSSIARCFLLDAGTFTSYLTIVKNWLDNNPNEVITLLLVNSDGILPSVWAASYEAAGLNTYAYTPSSVPIAYGDWPTYQELITAGSRVVSFLAQNADVSTAPYLLDEFTNIWETPFGVSRSVREGGDDLGADAGFRDTRKPMIRSLARWTE